MSKELIFLKPDAIERKLVGKIVSRLEDAGFRIVKARKGRITRELVELLYPNSQGQLEGMGKKTIKATFDRGGTEKDLQDLFGTKDPYELGQELNSWNRTYATSADIMAFILEDDKEAAPTRIRELVGSTDSSVAKKGTIRGDFTNDSIFGANSKKRAIRNLIHASDRRKGRLSRWSSSISTSSKGAQAREGKDMPWARRPSSHAAPRSSWTGSRAAPRPAPPSPSRLREGAQGASAPDLVSRQ